MGKGVNTGGIGEKTLCPTACVMGITGGSGQHGTWVAGHGNCAEGGSVRRGGTILPEQLGLLAADEFHGMCRVGAVGQLLKGARVSGKLLDS